MVKKIRKDDLIRTGQFAEIMGVSDQTIRTGVLRGYYNEIRIILTPRGRMYHIFDIFKYAHPNANNDTIEKMIFDYRMAKSRTKQIAKLKAKNKKKEGLKKNESTIYKD